MITYEKRPGDNQKKFYKDETRISLKNIKATDDVVMIDRIGNTERSRGTYKGSVFIQNRKLKA